MNDQHLLAAYRQGVLEARLAVGSLTGSSQIAGFDTFSSSHGIDPYILLASPASMIPSSSLASQIELLMMSGTAERRTPLSSILSTSLPHPQGQNPMGIMTQVRDINSLLRSTLSENLMKSAIDFPLFSSATNLSMNPSNPNMKEVSSSLCGKYNESNSSQRSTKNFRKKKANRKSRKSHFMKPLHKKLSRNHSIHEDAQLLLETAGKIASTDRENSMKSSARCNILDTSLFSQERLTKGSEPSCVDLSGTVPDFLLIAMDQMSITRLNPHGQSVKSKASHEYGFVGMSCKHCKNLIGFGSHFFKSLLNGSHSHRIVKHIQHSCVSCPDDVKETVAKLCTPSACSALASRLSDPDKSCQRFLDHLKCQLIISDVLDKDCSIS